MHKSLQQNVDSPSLLSFNLRLVTVLIDFNVILLYIFVLKGTGREKNLFAPNGFIPSSSAPINSQTKTSFVRKEAVFSIICGSEDLRSLYNLSSTIGYESLRVSSVDLANNLENGVLFED